MSGACVLVADSAIRRGLLLHSSFNHDKKSEGTAEIAMATKVPDSVDEYVGSRVRMRRLMLDMSQEKLGNELGITFQQVQKYEKGTNRISASRLQAMSHILQVPVPFFFEGAPQIAGRVGKGAAAPSPAYVAETTKPVPPPNALAPIEQVATPSALVVPVHRAVPTWMVTLSPAGVASPFAAFTVAENVTLFSLPRFALVAVSATVVVLESFDTMMFWVGLELDAE